MKRLAKLQVASSSSSTPSPSNPATSSSARPTPPAAKPVPKRTAEPHAALSPVPPKKKAILPPLKFNYSDWENETITRVFKVTLDPTVALQSGNEIVWLKSYMEDEASSLDGVLRIGAERLEGIVIARLDLDPSPESHDEEYQPFLGRIPRDLTVFEYLIGCWKRLNSTKAAIFKRGYPPTDIQGALTLLDNMRHLIISYVGIDLMSPDAFPHPQGYDIGAAEFVGMLLSFSSFSSPLFGGSLASENSLNDSDIQPFLQDIVHRFDPDGELEDVMGDIVRKLLFHPSLFNAEGIAASDSIWRGVVGGLEALVSQKEIARMITRMEEWNPSNLSAAMFERFSLLGPLLRLNVFERDWPYITKTYFTELEGRPSVDVQSSLNSLRGALKNLQASIFQVVNTIVRASPECREAVLSYFSRILSLNIKRAGSHVDPNTVASDSFMANVQLILLRLAEPFIDLKFTKMDRIDPHFYAHSSRVNVKDETRINATSEEASQWAESHRLSEAPPPNFISDIYFLTLAMSHYGLGKTIDNFEELGKELEELKRRLKTIEEDTTWAGSPFQARMEAAIKQTKAQMSDIKAKQAAATAQLYDPEFLFRNNTFVTFVITWLIRLADPKKTHPNPVVDLPLPKNVPMDFRILPEYILEDVIDYYSFVTRGNPKSLELTGREELLVFIITFLTSTWYIKNPFLKNKLIDILWFANQGYYRGEPGILTNLMNSHDVALKHLMYALMHFYIEVEQTGASSQFYDKFSKQPLIASVLKLIWNNPPHREALRAQTQNIDKFIRFVNLMINDVTYLLDESLSDMARIHTIEDEMADQQAWAARPLQQRRERESTLHGLERQATSYNSLGSSTVNLLKVFTAEIKEPFMVPEIVDKLAAMLDYNLDVLVGPKCQDLKVKDKEKYYFKPRELLRTLLQVYLNLGEQSEFTRAVANDGRSYKKELFEKAAGISARTSMLSPTEIEQLRLFVIKVEEAKATMEAEEDLGEIPDEFLDPLMFTIMRDPVILPLSRAVIDRSTIKSHLLSDTKDPFNRAPLTIEEVVPDVDLKARIDAFLSERRNSAKPGRPEDDVVMAESDAMDTSI
ncbi:ubiquitin elongating factor core-domain-containing protein [Amylostereum chailletii]|nr:ubiquitin elongating factor core-domain-containing protein [Amylostereum chailletii]